MAAEANVHPYLHSKALRSFLSVDESKNEMDPKDMHAFLERITRREYEDGSKIVTEGESGDSFYLIDQGQIDIVKESEGNKLLNRLGGGDYFGELALLMNKPRAATAIARGNAVLFQLRKREFDELTHLFPGVFGVLLNKLYGRLQSSFHSLERKNEELQASFRLRSEMGFIFISTVVVISLYSFVIRLFHGNGLHGAPSETVNFIVTRALEVLALGIIIGIIRKSKLPLHRFGVTFEGAARGLPAMLGISLAAVLLLTAGKWLSRPGLRIAIHAPAAARKSNVRC